MSPEQDRALATGQAPTITSSSGMTTVKVVVQADHLLRLAQRSRPLTAIEELVWNSLDGDATRVEVDIETCQLGGVSLVRVTDNGTGISYEKALAAFGSLGASWKRGCTSPSGRSLHGTAGQGRFCAFAIGAEVRWKSCYLEGSGYRAIEIVGCADHLAEFEVTRPKVSPHPCTSTVVEISGVNGKLPSLLSDEAPLVLAEKLALYLSKYTSVEVFYRGTKVDPTGLERCRTDYLVPGVLAEDGSAIDASLTVIEWNVDLDRQLLLCDTSGVALAEFQPGIKAPGYSFTAYVRSNSIRGWHEKNVLVELYADVKTLLDAAKDQLRSHFKKRASEEAAAKIEQWKSEKVYPFEGSPTSPVDEVARQLFDVVALNLSEHLPSFAEADGRSKRFSLKMLKTAIEQSPSEVRKVIQEVLELPPEKLEELVELLDRTSLTSIINASKVIVDRLDFLAGLQVLLYEAESKRKLLERSQLHHIIADIVWLFGEQFHLSVNDEGLTQVLAKHIECLGRTELAEEKPVTTLDGTTGIVDLMLSRKTQISGAESFEHLVIELKRPMLKVSATETTQIEKYAMAVAEDERFRNSKVNWVFWVVSNDMDKHVRNKVTRQPDRPYGMLMRVEEPAITVWVKTWNEVLDDCTRRLQFFQEKLNYMATQERGLGFLRKTYSKLIPDHLKST